MKNPYPRRGRDWRARVGLIVLTGSVSAWPATGMASPSCSISPQNATIEAREDINFRATTDDLRRWSQTYNWTFEEGSPSSSNRRRPTVEFNKAGGPWKVVLKVSDGRLEAECMTTVSVSGGDETANVAPSANANGPYSGTAGLAVSFSSSGSNDADGSVASYAWTFGDGGTSSSPNPTHTYASAGSYTVSLTVTDNDGATASASTTATITAPVACTSHIPEHCQITVYTGPEVCVECHQKQAIDMHGSVHYQQGGAFPNVTNIPEDYAAAGERPAKAAGDLVATGINTYCGTHENSPRFTCAGCHVGNGRFPMAQSEFELLDPTSAEAHVQLANIDCLTCHQEAYKRFPDWTAGPTAAKASRTSRC